MPDSLVLWNGSKRWLVHKFPEFLPHPISSGRALDLFVGGGAVSLHYLRLGFPVVMNDTNVRLIGCYAMLRDRPDRVIRELEALDLAHRASSNRSESHSFEAAARFLFVLRSGYNGLWRVNKRGECNVPYGDPFALRNNEARRKAVSRDFVRADDLRTIAKLLQRAEIRSTDFTTAGKEARPHDVVYLDPPFVRPRGFVSYTSDKFTSMDRARLLDLLALYDKLRVPWLLSDVASDETEKLYTRWTIRRLQVMRASLRRRHLGVTGELLVSPTWRK